MGLIGLGFLPGGVVGFEMLISELTEKIIDKHRKIKFARLSKKLSAPELKMGDSGKSKIDLSSINVDEKEVLDEIIEFVNSNKDRLFEGVSTFGEVTSKINVFEHGIVIHKIMNKFDSMYDEDDNQISVYIFDDGQVGVHESSLYGQHGKPYCRTELSEEEKKYVEEKLGKEYTRMTEAEIHDEVKRDALNAKIDELKNKKIELLFSQLVEARKRLDQQVETIEAVGKTIESTGKPVNFGVPSEVISSGQTIENVGQSILSSIPVESAVEGAYGTGPMKEVGPRAVDAAGKSNEPVLPQGFEWCRKAKYDVLIELGCYIIDDEHPLMPGFESMDIERDGVMKTYAVKAGTNELEGNNWLTNPDRPYIITGTVGERWPVKPSNLGSYEVNPEDITPTPLPISTKDPSDQEFLVACHIPDGQNVKVISKWAFKDDGTIDESQVLTTNLPDSKIPHANGDYIVAKHIEGEPEYMELPEEVRNTKEAATKYSPRVINGSVMETTYDHAATKEEIIDKYMSSKAL